MSGKREASYSIDPNTLEEKEKDQQQHTDSKNTQQKNGKHQRVIFKIKRPGSQGPTEVPSSKVSFKLNQSQQIKPTTTTQSQEAQKKVETSQNPFTNLFKSNTNTFNGIGMFSNVKSTNLFASNKPGEEGLSMEKVSLGPQKNIFASTGPNIFSSSLKNTSASLFQKAASGNAQDDGSGDSAELQKVQNIQADPQKSKATFDYGDLCPIIMTAKVAKFKKSGGELIENVEVVLQKQKQTHIKYITVRIPVTKKSIFSGILVQGRSDIRHIHGKKQNVQVAAFYKEKQTFVKVFLKFQFQKPQEGQKFYQRLQELLKTQKNTKQDQKTNPVTEQTKN